MLHKYKVDGVKFDGHLNRFDIRLVVCLWDHNNICVDIGVVDNFLANSKLVPKELSKNSDMLPRGGDAV